MERMENLYSYCNDVAPTAKKAKSLYSRITNARRNIYKNTGVDLRPFTKNQVAYIYSKIYDTKPGEIIGFRKMVEIMHNAYCIQEKPKDIVITTSSIRKTKKRITAFAITMVTLAFVAGLLLASFL